MSCRARHYTQRLLAIKFFLELERIYFCQTNQLLSLKTLLHHTVEHLFEALFAAKAVQFSSIPIRPLSKCVHNKQVRIDLKYRSQAKRPGDPAKRLSSV